VLLNFYCFLEVFKRGPLDFEIALRAVLKNRTGQGSCIITTLYNCKKLRNKYVSIIKPKIKKLSESSDITVKLDVT
jgi:hypothetical protein